MYSISRRLGGKLVCSTVLLRVPRRFSDLGDDGLVGEPQEVANMPALRLSNSEAGMPAARWAVLSLSPAAVPLRLGADIVAFNGGGGADGSRETFGSIQNCASVESSNGETCLSASEV